MEKAHKIRNKKWYPVEEREVSYSEIKKGYEIAKDDYILIDKLDLDRIGLFLWKYSSTKQIIFRPGRSDVHMATGE